MSAMTTIYITRSAAVAAINKQMAIASNEELSECLNVALADQLMNCKIVPDGTDKNDDDLLEE